MCVCVHIDFPFPLPLSPTPLSEPSSPACFFFHLLVKGFLPPPPLLPLFGEAKRKREKRRGWGQSDSFHPPHAMRSFIHCVASFHFFHPFFFLASPPLVYVFSLSFSFVNFFYSYRGSSSLYIYTRRHPWRDIFLFTKKTKKKGGGGECVTLSTPTGRARL